jgi:hypothetical protein
MLDQDPNLDEAVKNRVLDAPPSTD